METRPASPILSTSSVTIAKSLNHATLCNWTSLAGLTAARNLQCHTQQCSAVAEPCPQDCCDQVYIFYNLSFCIPPSLNGKEGRVSITMRFLFEVHQFQKSLWPFSGEKMSWDGVCLAWSTHLGLPRTSPVLALTVPSPRKPLGPKQTWTVGHPNVASYVPWSLDLHD